MIDDDKSYARLTARFLKKQGYEVDVAYDRDGAIVLAEKLDGGLEIVVCDTEFTGDDGPSIIRYLQQAYPDKFSSARVIGVSGNGKVMQDWDGIAYATLGKPYRKDVFYTAIKL